MSAEIDWDTYEPTPAVRKAAILLSSADTVDATCFGWVPQAHEALAAALTDDLLARAIFHAIDETRSEGRQASWDGLASSERGYWRGISIDVRARLLGADS